jgi:hypothetical protein
MVWLDVGGYCQLVVDYHFSYRVSPISFSPAFKTLIKAIILKFGLGSRFGMSR